MGSAVYWMGTMGQMLHNSLTSRLGLVHFPCFTMKAFILSLSHIIIYLQGLRSKGRRMGLRGNDGSAVIELWSRLDRQSIKLWSRLILLLKLINIKPFMYRAQRRNPPTVASPICALSHRGRTLEEVYGPPGLCWENNYLDCPIPGSPPVAL